MVGRQDLYGNGDQIRQQWRTGQVFVVSQFEDINHFMHFVFNLYTAGVELDHPAECTFALDRPHVSQLTEHVKIIVDQDFFTHQHVKALVVFLVLPEQLTEYGLEHFVEDRFLVTLSNFFFSHRKTPLIK